MVGVVEQTTQTHRFSFIRGTESEETELEWSNGRKKVQKAFSKSLNAKNVAFLLGAGCSSLMVGNEEVGIPTMARLAKEFLNKQSSDSQTLSDLNELSLLMDRFGIDISAEDYSHNLERLMEVLFSLRFIHERSSLAEAGDILTSVNLIIQKVQSFLWKKCNKEDFSSGDNRILHLYEMFYRKLVFRDRSLPRPWVFTTNYDLFNEMAMDRLGLPYANGFSGVVERRFNPAMFRYALAEQFDLTNRKWSAVDGFIYLCKLHGSISWIEDEHGLFHIRESMNSTCPEKVMIYPTPAKQNSALGAPYADLFREFQSRIVREQSVLYTIGYAFGDEHINNIIYQALTVPTFRLVIFANPVNNYEIAKLRGLNDPRIWIIGGEGPGPGRKAHYFGTVVENFMPPLPSERIDEAVKKVLKNVFNEHS